MRRFDRAASHTPSRVTYVAVAAALVAVLGVLSYLAAVAPRGVPTVDYYEVRAEFEDSADLRLLSAVHVAGRRAGQVGTIEHDGDKVVLKLQLSPGEGPLRSDTTARIRLKNPVGAKYVELSPGRRGRPLPDGATLPARQTSTTVDTSEFLEAFDPATRRDLQDTVQGLGGGFAGRGQDVNDAIVQGRPLLADARALSEGVLAREGAAARFAPSAASAAEAYDPVRRDLAAGLRSQARVLRAFSESRPAIQGTLEAAPPALSALRRGLDASVPLLAETAGLARAAVRFTDPAPAALRETTALLREGREPLERSRPLFAALGEAARPTAAALERLDPLVAPTARAVRNQLRPLGEFGARDCDVLAWGRVWRSALSYGVPPGTDPGSDLDNDQGIGPLNSYRVIGVPQDDEESLAADAPGKDFAVGRNPYPDPCEAARDRLGP